MSFSWLESLLTSIPCMASCLLWPVCVQLCQCSASCGYSAASRGIHHYIAAPISCIHHNQRPCCAAVALVQCPLQAGRAVDPSVISSSQHSAPTASQQPNIYTTLVRASTACCCAAPGKRSDSSRPLPTVRNPARSQPGYSMHATAWGRTCLCFRRVATLRRNSSLHAPLPDGQRICFTVGHCCLRTSTHNLNNSADLTSTVSYVQDTCNAACRYVLEQMCHPRYHLLCSTAIVIQQDAHWRSSDHATRRFFFNIVPS